MATDTDTLITIRNNLLDRIVEITNNQKPSYNIDGQEVDWATYLMRLHRMRKEITEEIDNASGDNYEEISQGVT